MDSKTNHNSTKTDESVPVGVQTGDIKGDTSRFSRRRFLRSAAVASPILLSVKSPTAWGNTTLYSEQCSLTVFLSGNPSNPSELGCEARDITYWINVFSGGNKLVEDELERRGVTATTLFFQIFPLSAFQSWRKGGIYDHEGNSLYYRINQMSANPTLLQALQGTGFELKLDLAENPDTAQEDIDEVVLTDNVPSFHAVMVAAYLNSLFHPTPLAYLGDAQYVSDQLAVTLQDVVDALISDITSAGSVARMAFRFGTVNISGPLQQLTDDLNTWDDWDV